MITAPDFNKKQIVFVFFNEGEKLSFKNDNLIVSDAQGKTKLQCTCYRLFLVYAVGSFTITSGLVQRAEKFGFSIALFTSGFRLYGMIGSKKDGNTMLREKQYTCEDIGIAKHIIKNKIACQYGMLKGVRRKSEELKHAEELLREYFEKITLADGINSIMGYEGLASKVYFKQHFDNILWYGRQPRIKRDIPNSLLDVGYTLLFAFVEALLNAFGFDTYKGVLHQQFYMRKSLVCDMVEPFRCLIDKEVKKAFNLGIIKEDDFALVNYQYRLNWKASPKYISFLMKPIIDNKDQIFLFIQQYYRCFMKGLPISEFPVYIEGKVVYGIDKL